MSNIRSNQEADMWRAVIASWRVERGKILAQLIPLQEGRMRTGERSRRTRGLMIDTTKEDTARLQQNLSNINKVIAQNEHRAH